MLNMRAARSFAPGAGLPRPGLLSAALFLLAFTAAAAQQDDADPPSRAEAQQMIDQAYRQTRSADSIEQFDQIIKLTERAAEADLPEAHAAYVGDLLGWAFNRRGEALAEQAAQAAREGDGARAAELDAQSLADFEQAIEHDPDRWKAVHNRGVSRAVAGNYAEAVEDFSRVIELQENYANAWFNRGEIRNEMGQHAEAIEDYTEAIRLSPRDAASYISRGHAHFQLGQFVEALADYNQAVRLQPASALAHANRGDAYRSLGQWEQAARDYRQAINLDNQLARAYQGAAWLMATCPDPRYRNPQLAVQSARRAVDLVGEQDYRYLDTLAAAYANAGQFERAEQVLGESIELAPQRQRSSLEERLALYRQRQPYRQQASAAAAAP